MDTNDIITTVLVNLFKNVKTEIEPGDELGSVKVVSSFPKDATYSMLALLTIGLASLPPEYKVYEEVTNVYLKKLANAAAGKYSNEDGTIKE